MLDKIKIDRLIHKIGLENKLSDDVVREIVESQFEYTKEKLNELNKDINKLEEFDESYSKVFYFKALCKLYICKYRLKALIERRNFIKKVNKNVK